MSTPHTLRNYLSILWGIALSIFLGAVTYRFFYYVSPEQQLDHILSGVAGMLVVATCFWAGVENVEIGHEALLLVLGARSRIVRFGEGWNWIPPIGTIVLVDCREHVIEVPKVVALSKDGVAVTIDISIRARISDAALYLSFSEAYDGLMEEVRELVRILCSSIESTESYLEEARLASRVQDQASQRAGVYGIAIQSTFVSDVRVLDLEGEFVGLQRAKIKSEADMVRALSLVERTKELVTTGIDVETALNTAQVEAGLVDKKEIVGTASDLLKAAGLLSNK